MNEDTENKLIATIRQKEGYRTLRRALTKIL